MPKGGASQRRSQRPRAESCGVHWPVAQLHSSSCPKVSNASVARCVPRCVFAEFTLGHPGHCDEGRAQNLIAMCMAALTPSPFAFILHVFVAQHTRSAFSPTPRRSPLLRRCRRRLSIDAGPTDSIGAPAWLFQWPLAPRRVGKHTAWR